MKILLDRVFIFIYDPKYLSEEQKIYGLLKLMRSMKLSALDVVTMVLGKKPEYRPWKEGLMRGNAFDRFLM